MTSDMLSPDELAAIKQQKETQPMEPEPTTHTVAEVIAQFKAQIVRHPQNGKPADGYWEAVDDMVSALEVALAIEAAALAGAPTPEQQRERNG